MVFPQGRVLFKPLLPFLQNEPTNHNHVLVASELIQSIDFSVDPCEDFYSFACNGWIKNHPLPRVRLLHITRPVTLHRVMTYVPNHNI